jgi:hypothetical protein
MEILDQRPGGEGSSRSILQGSGGKVCSGAAAEGTDYPSPAHALFFSVGRDGRECRRRPYCLGEI